MSVLVRLAVFALLAPLLAACGDAAQKPPAPPPAQVTVAKPAKQTVVDQDEYVGRFVAVDLVEIRSRVSGYLSKVHFQDGQLVKSGDLLFSIDQRPFQNALDQTRGTLAQSKANLAFTTFNTDGLPCAIALTCRLIPRFAVFSLLNGAPWAT